MASTAERCGLRFKNLFQQRIFEVGLRIASRKKAFSAGRLEGPTFQHNRLKAQGQIHMHYQGLAKSPSLRFQSVDLASTSHPAYHLVREHQRA